MFSRRARRVSVNLSQRGVDIVEQPRQRAIPRIHLVHVVDGDGNYCGGVIAPGINLSLAALHMAAAKLPAIRIRRTERVIGKDTVSCMQSGIYWGYIGLVEGLVGRIKAEFGTAMRTIATGGLAPVFEGATPVIELVDPTLSLWGLRLIHELNRPA